MARRFSAAPLWPTIALSVPLAGCGLQREEAPNTGKVEWRTGRIEQAGNASVGNQESMGSRVALGMMGGLPGLVMALNTEKNLGTSSIWRYGVRDGESVVQLQSFAVFKPGDCVRWLVGGNPADTPMERLPAEQCGAR
jgi:hypothetical protein